MNLSEPIKQLVFASLELEPGYNELKFWSHQEDGTRFKIYECGVEIGLAQLTEHFEVIPYFYED